MASPPQPDEIEVSVFGPGFGEAVLVHIGNGRWLSVDSSYNSVLGEPVAFTYLRDLGVDPARAIQLVLVTHWHDDHIRGLSDIVGLAAEADFCCPGVFTNREFLALLATFNVETMTKLSGGASELFKIMRVLRLRGQRPKFIGADRVILRVPASELAHNNACEVISLSPSDRQVELFLESVADVHIFERKTKFRAVADDPNLVSAACQIDFGSISILLGADLEETGDPALGWSSVLASTGRPSTRSVLFKVPHHGSQNGHHDLVWSTMLDDEPIAVVTPFTRLANRLPTPSDLRRIRRFTNKAYSTAPREGRAFRPDLKSVERTLNETGARITNLIAEPGRVTTRFRSDAGPSITLHGGAHAF